MGYSPEEEKLLEEAFAGLMESCRNICKNDEDRNLIKRAYFLAKEAHEGVRRRSGQPYLLHPIAVAHIVVDEIGLGVKSVVTALLHDVVEDTDYSIEDIDRIFGPKISNMVDGLTKMTGVFSADTSEQAEYFRKVLLTLSSDVRVIIIKIADRLHNLRTLQYLPRDKQIKITSETIYLFAPLAHRLGLYAIKTEMENLCMLYRFPTEYDYISQRLHESESERSECIDRFCTPIRKTLDENGIKYEMTSRVKSIYSIWSKMQRKQIPFDEVYDLFAIRIVFTPSTDSSEKTQCWKIYALITDLYTPKPDRLRDWLSTPKTNGYEALHSTFMGPDGQWIEVQIRSDRMNDIAERGFAAHWKYKNATVSHEDGALDNWLKQFQKALSSSTENAVEFLDNFKLSLFTSEITVFTPKGEQRKLPFGATALDLAYDLHTSIGNKAIGAKINHKIEPVTKQLQSGDQVEIITADNAKPKSEWLDVVTTTKARQKITMFLKREQEGSTERGFEQFTEALERNNIQNSGRVLRKVLPAYGCISKDEFYSKIGAGIISLNNIDDLLKSSSKSKTLKFWKLFKSSGKQSADESGPTIEQFTLAHCCNPLPGDDVVGYRDPVSGEIIIHKSSCSEFQRLATCHGENIVNDKIRWTQQKAISYLCSIELRGIDRNGMLMDISKVSSEDLNTNIREIALKSHDGIIEGYISFYVINADSLNRLMDKFRKVKGLESVRRLDEIK